MTLSDFIDSVLQAVKIPFSLLFDGNEQERVYYPFLISAIVLSFFIYKKGKYKSSFSKYLFNSKIWMGESARVDYYFIFLNAFVKVFILSPFVFSSFYFALVISDVLLRFIGEYTLTESMTWLIILYTGSLLVVKDLFVFLIHYAMHKIPLLWNFHKVHHSATTMNPFTQFRIHPVELILNNCTALFAISLVTGIFDYLSSDGIGVYTAIGSNIFLLLFKYAGANLRHSHVKFKYPRFLEKLLISPYQHQIHHSTNPRFFNKNMGSILAIWDRLFGTLSLSDEVKHLRFGLGVKDEIAAGNFWANLFLPFVSFLKSIFSKKHS